MLQWLEHFVDNIILSTVNGKRLQFQDQHERFFVRNRNVFDQDL